MGTLIPPLNLKTTMTYQLCDVATPLGLRFECTLNTSIWVQSSRSVYHSGPEEGRVHPNRSQEENQDYRLHEPISFSSLSYLFYFAPHTQTVCVAAGELCRLNDNFKPLKESGGTSYTTDLSKLGGSVASYALVNSMHNGKGGNTWKLEGRGKEG